MFRPVEHKVSVGKSHRREPIEHLGSYRKELRPVRCEVIIGFKWVTVICNDGLL